MDKKNETKPIKEIPEELTRTLRRQAHRYLDKVEQYKLPKPELVIIAPGAPDELVQIIAKAFGIGVADTESIKTVEIKTGPINAIYLQVPGDTNKESKVIKDLPKFVKVVAVMKTDYDSLMMISHKTE